MFLLQCCHCVVDVVSVLGVICAFNRNVENGWADLWFTEFHLTSLQYPDEVLFPNNKQGHIKMKYKVSFWYIITCKWRLPARSLHVECGNHKLILSSFS